MQRLPGSASGLAAELPTGQPPPLPSSPSAITCVFVSASSSFSGIVNEIGASTLWTGALAAPHVPVSVDPLGSVAVNPVWPVGPVTPLLPGMPGVPVAPAGPVEPGAPLAPVAP